MARKELLAVEHWWMMVHPIQRQCLSPGSYLDVELMSVLKAHAVSVLPGRRVGGGPINTTWLTNTSNPQKEKVVYVGK